jgi:hypothetical protein
MIDKTLLYNLSSDTLEGEKIEIFSRFSQGKGSRELRNRLYELLGVMEHRKRHPNSLILDVPSLA